MKQGSTVAYLHGDHLGSTSVATGSKGAMTSRQTREAYAFGVVRTTEGTLPTDYTFTGQKRLLYKKLALIPRVSRPHLFARGAVLFLRFAQAASLGAIHALCVCDEHLRVSGALSQRRAANGEQKKTLR